MVRRLVWLFCKEMGSHDYDVCTMLLLTLELNLKVWIKWSINWPMNIQDFQHRTKFRLWFDKDKRWIHGPHKRNDLGWVNLFGETIILWGFHGWHALRTWMTVFLYNSQVSVIRTGKIFLKVILLLQTVNQTDDHWEVGLPSELDSSQDIL